MSDGLTAFMFPGQGSQSVGMFSRLLGEQPEAMDRVKEAEHELGWPLLSLMDHGPEEALRDTANAQPALLTMGVACAEALMRLGYAPDLVLGHSVGEYAALVVGGALGFTDAMGIVKLRGQLMAAASRVAPGGMVAVVGAKEDALASVLEHCRPFGLIEVTNYNAPSQVVLSGETVPLEAAVALLAERRVGRAVPLRVSAPFHSALMRPLAEEFSVYLKSVHIRPPSAVFIDNVTGQREKDPERIRVKLVEQLYRPVFWQRSVETACGLGGHRFVESGPGRVLTGLVKHIRRDTRRVLAEQVLGPSSVL